MNNHFKKFLIMVFVLSITAQAWAFVFEVPILEKDKIASLSDDALTDNYIDVLVETEAVKAFYSKGGFTPKEYDKYKDLLRYKIFLTLEMQKRKMEIPKYNP